MTRLSNKDLTIHVHTGADCPCCSPDPMLSEIFLAEFTDEKHIPVRHDPFPLTITFSTRKAGADSDLRNLVQLLQATGLAKIDDSGDVSMPGMFCRTTATHGH